MSVTPLRAWLGLAALVLPTLLVAVDNTVLGFALPQLSEALSPTSTQLLWIVDVYPLVLAGLLVTMGTLGDRIGRRKLLLVGVTGFGLVSLAAAFATTATQLVVARALLGFFGAMLMPSTLALLRTLFVDRAARRLALAVWATGFAGGAAVGPVVGGVLLEHFWWGSVFLLGVPVMVLMLVAGPLLLPESRVERPGSLDLVGVVLSLLTMTPAVLAVKLAAHDGVTASVLLAAGVAVASGVLFVRRARSRVAAGEEPLLDVTLFSAPVLRLSALANASTMFALTGLLFVAAQYLLLVSGLTPLQAGLVIVPSSLTTMAAGLLAARLGRRYGVRTLVPVGLLLAAAGMGLLVPLGSGGTAGAVLLGVAATVAGAGIGLSETITNDAILSAAPADRAGAASAVSETAYEVGAVLGTAVLGSVLAAVYSRALVVPSSVGPAYADQARETLGGASAAAGRLTGPSPVEAAALLDSARSAFTSGVGVTAALGAAVLVVVAVVVTVGLRPRRTAAEPDLVHA